MRAHPEWVLKGGGIPTSELHLLQRTSGCRRAWTTCADHSLWQTSQSRKQERPATLMIRRHKHYHPRHRMQRGGPANPWDAGRPAPCQPPVPTTCAAPAEPRAAPSRAPQLAATPCARTAVPASSPAPRRLPQPYHATVNRSPPSRCSRPGPSAPAAPATKPAPRRPVLPQPHKRSPPSRCPHRLSPAQAPAQPPASAPDVHASEPVPRLAPPPVLAQGGSLLLCSAPLPAGWFRQRPGFVCSRSLPPRKAVRGLSSVGRSTCRRVWGSSGSDCTSPHSLLDTRGAAADQAPKDAGLVALPLHSEGCTHAHACGGTAGGGEGGGAAPCLRLLRRRFRCACAHVCAWHPCRLPCAASCALGALAAHPTAGIRPAAPPAGLAPTCHVVHQRNEQLHVPLIFFGPHPAVGAQQAGAGAGSGEGRALQLDACVCRSRQHREANVQRGAHRTAAPTRHTALPPSPAARAFHDSGISPASTNHL